jgi:hypothetical protein
VHVLAYTDLTTARVPEEEWLEAATALLSWRGWLQSIPGVRHVQIAGRRDEDHHVVVVVSTSFELVEQLVAYRDGPWPAARVLDALPHAVQDIKVETLEELT